MAYADWSSYQYQEFHDSAFIEQFNRLDMAFISDTQYERLEELYEAGWLNLEISEAERDSYRYDFYNESGYYFTAEDWELYREIYDQANG